MNYQRKKYKLNLMKFTYFLTITILLTATISLLLSNSAIGKQTINYKTIVIKKGDNLWKVAQRNNSNSSHEEYINELYKINGMKTSNLYPGQKIKIPLY